MYKVKIKDSEYSLEPTTADFSLGTINETPFSLDIKKTDQGWSVMYNDKSYVVDALYVDKETKMVTLEVNGVRYEVNTKDKYDVLLDQLGMSSAGTGKVGDVKAPMPGLVLDIKVSEGDSVSKDQPLLVLEAMKMENVIKSPTEGVVKSISVKPTQAVEKNQLLITFEK